jgi:two-component system chemotaxis response regulator CheB
LPEPIRVLVAEDSPTVRAHIVRVLRAAPGMTVVGEASDGRQAIERCLALRPDVITLDMMMPVLSGLAATEYIMAFAPTPIIIVSGSTDRGEVFRTMDALSAGALEVLEKPKAHESIEAWEARLIDTVRLASRIRVITHPRGRLNRTLHPENNPESLLIKRPGRGPRLVAIGASTGGPKAIVDVLQELPRTFSLPILVVTHISQTFSAGFIDWLGANLRLPVRGARDGDDLTHPGVLVAPADRHMVVQSGQVRLMDGAPRHSCRPSVDVLFESVAAASGGNGIAALLTGMGRDGAEGLLAIRRAGGVTVAQDEKSSVIFGMPGEAVRLGAAEHVLPPAGIGALLRALDVGAQTRQ